MAHQAQALTFFSPFCCLPVLSLNFRSQVEAAGPSVPCHHFPAPTPLRVTWSLPTDRSSLGLGSMLHNLPDDNVGLSKVGIPFCDVDSGHGFRRAPRTKVQCPPQMHSSNKLWQFTLKCGPLASPCLATHLSLGRAGPGTCSSYP